jgi:hypothetical protein
MESKIWEKLKGINLDEMTPSQIREFLIERGIGIDCSGFVTYILDSMSINSNGKHIWTKLKDNKNGFYAKVRYMLRPVEQLGADVITNEVNCIKISINDVKPGDLIRSKARRSKGDHIMIVTEVNRDENNNVTSIVYTHSTPNYGDKNGVKTGEIKIIDLNKPLHEQQWLETDDTGVVPTLEGFMIDVEDNGLRRLK